MTRVPDPYDVALFVTRALDNLGIVHNAPLLGVTELLGLALEEGEG